MGADGSLTDKWRCWASKYTKLTKSLEAENWTVYISHRLVTMPIPWLADYNCVWPSLFIPVMCSLLVIQSNQAIWLLPCWYRCFEISHLDTRCHFVIKMEILIAPQIILIIRQSIAGTSEMARECQKEYTYFWAGENSTLIYSVSQYSYVHLQLTLKYFLFKAETSSRSSLF